MQNRALKCKIIEDKAKMRVKVAEVNAIAKVRVLQAKHSLLIPVLRAQAAQHTTIAAVATEQVQKYARSTTISTTKRFLDSEEGTVKRVRTRKGQSNYDDSSDHEIISESNDEDDYQIEQRVLDLQESRIVHINGNVTEGVDWDVVMRKVEAYRTQLKKGSCEQDLDSVMMLEKNSMSETEHQCRNIMPLLDATIRIDNQYRIKYGEQSLEATAARRNKGRDPNDRARRK
ncbi:hypothetical protein BC936DRAFT_139897 [Jimgerdemannia flammicorona]|uniref:Uncharacterized protein n=1 Tax=Jimgerdemannia flammicorona TaxID=994334 RepID=A0A433B935_9FUNG|nr:hypothetical protein BC936DRAFT_139897 [Jimgerdemannia flammicorona]